VESRDGDDLDTADGVALPRLEAVDAPMREAAAGVESTVAARDRNARPAASRLSGCWSCESSDVDRADLVGRPGRPVSLWSVTVPDG
jgi:hypothetical protein